MTNPSTDEFKVGDFVQTYNRRLSGKIYSIARASDGIAFAAVIDTAQRSHHAYLSELEPAS